MKPSFWSLVVDYFRAFRVLRQTPREYWSIQLINFLDCFAYFGLLTVITLFLSEEMQLNDKDAGYVVTVFTSLTAVLLFGSGLVTDTLGIRRSVYWAMLSRGAATAAVLALALLPDFPFRIALVVAAFVAMAPSMAMMQTVFQSSIKRFTNDQSRGAGFNLWYLFMNIGAAASGVAVDVFRLSLGLSTTWIIGLGCLTSILCLLIAFFSIRTERQFGANGQFEELRPEAAKPKPRFLQILRELTHATAFWRFCVLFVLLLGVRSVFVYVYLLMPKYWTRVLGEDAAIGTLNSINPVLIVIGLVVFIPFANRFSVFKMLVYGAIISSLSLFVLVVPWQLSAHTLDFFSGIIPGLSFKDRFVAAYYALSVLSMVLLSLGEVIWSPKLQEYVAAIAPEGQEGTYMGLSMLPWFFAKTLVGIASGHMLGRWVPEGIAEKLRSDTVRFWDNPSAMWLILGIIAIVGPLLALLFQGWFTAGVQWQKSSELEREG